tara:strand:+ start:240 stop:1052 length:813 start_codon:yes stop_codon:yes gene_type:complete
MNILIIGKNSFISLELNKYLKNKFKIVNKNYKDIKNKKTTYFDKFNYLINCTSNQSFVKEKYKSKNDHDYQISKKIMNTNVFQIFLSSRKVYFPGKNIKENDKTKPSCNYSKNKIISENKLINTLDNRVLILRTSNLIGFNNIVSKRKLHNTFIDIFFKNAKNGFIFKNQNIYKDFLSTKKFSEIIEKLIKKNASGIFNVSTGKKVYLDNLIGWLNYYNPKKIKLIKNKVKKNKENFYLCNKKLKNFIKINTSLTELKKECKKVSKLYFS